jgi:hypothetical protein
VAEEAVKELLGELLNVQDEQLASLRSIQQGITQIGQDVAQLIEGPYWTAREMLERAMIPGRSPDAMQADLQAAAAEFLRAAGQHRQDTLPRASAYMEASFVQGLLGDVPAMLYYGDKAWREGVAALQREAENATSVLRRSAETARRGQRSLWSRHDDRKYSRDIQLLKWGEGGANLAEIFPEARAVENAHETKRQVDVYRDAAANLAAGPDILPYHMVHAELDMSPEYASVQVRQVYHGDQIINRRDEFASLLRELGINEHLYVSYLWPDDRTWIECFKLETIGNKDSRAAAFETDVKRILPNGLRLLGPVNESAGWPYSLLV